VKVRLGSILQEFKAKPPAGSNPEVLTLTERNGFVRQADRFNKRLATEDVSGYKYIELDDFAFNPYLLWAGAIARNGRFANGVISPLYPTFRVTPGNYAGYIERLVLSQQLISAYDNIAFGSVPRRRRSSVKDFLDLEVPPLPPLDEQRRIAAILDKADEIRTKRREAIAHLDTLTQSIFHSMFGDDVWSRTTLRDASLRFVGGRNLVGSGANAHPENKVLKVNAVSGGFFDPDQTKPLPADYLPPAEHLVATGDLIVTRASGTKDLIGVATPVSHVQDNTYLPDKLWKAKMDPGLLCPTFLRFLTKSARYREFVVNSSSGAAGVSNISQAKLLMFEFGLPPLELQQTFATRVAVVERLKELHRKHLAELNALFASLQDRAFKGEL
jgi:type I restriction enzyme, S subunit